MTSLAQAPVLLLALVAAIAWGGAWLIILGAPRLGLQDQPNHRSSHRRPTPRGGGVAIGAAVAAGALVWPAAAPALDARLWPGLFAVLALGAVGLVDDRRGLDYRIRLLAQAACLATILAATRIDAWLTAVGAPAPWLLLALVALAGLWWINLFNFMDGIDGLAASQAGFMLAAYLACGLFDGTPARDAGAASLSLLLLAATAGFLWLNRPPARLFMGDAGSLLLASAIVLVCAASVSAGDESPWFWIVCGGLFASDATVTLLRRWRAGVAVTSAHRSHVYQRLARRWGGHGRVTLVYFGVNLSWFLPLAYLSHLSPSWGPGIATIAYLPSIWACWKLGAGLPD